MLVVYVQEDDDLVVVVAHQPGDVAPTQALDVSILLGGRLVWSVGVLELDRHEVGKAGSQFVLYPEIRWSLRVALASLPMRAKSDVCFVAEPR